ncbi:Uncharacterised protein [Mycobacteroides abscessus subsp. abscessus]|nr:Uncharacterised protein [Mycobacteroides abscessus subsp. abscessus]
MPSFPASSAVSGPSRVKTFRSEAAMSTLDQNTILVRKSLSGWPRHGSVSRYVMPSRSVCTQWSSTRPCPSRLRFSRVWPSRRSATCWLEMVCSQLSLSGPDRVRTARVDLSMRTACVSAARCSPRGSP